MDIRINNYIKDLPSPQKEMVQELRRIIVETFPNIQESFKNGVPWYECKYYIAAFKDHVNLGFSVEGLSEEAMREFEGKGTYMRHLKFYSLESIDQAKIVRLLKLVT